MNKDAPKKIGISFLDNLEMLDFQYNGILHQQWILSLRFWIRDSWIVSAQTKGQKGRFFQSTWLACSMLLTSNKLVVVPRLYCLLMHPLVSWSEGLFSCEGKVINVTWSLSSQLSSWMVYFFKFVLEDQPTKHFFPTLFPGCVYFAFLLTG